MTRLAYWAASVLIDGLDLIAHLARAYEDWHQERTWRATSSAVTTQPKEHDDRR